MPPGFNKDTKMYGWSMAKSFTAALIGTLVQNGKLTVDEPAPVTEWSDAKDPRRAIKSRIYCNRQADSTLMKITLKRAI